MHNPYLWPNCQNFHVLKEIGVEEHDGDVRFYTRSGNAAVLHMCNKNMQYNFYLWSNRQNFHDLKETGVKNTMVMSDFTPEVEIQLF